MDRVEAGRLLSEKLVEFRKLTYAELVANIGNDQYLGVHGRSNTEYQIEIQVMWDDEKQRDIRVFAGIDDGSLRGAFRPVCEDFVMTPDGRILAD